MNHMIWISTAAFLLSGPLHAGSEHSGGTDYHPNLPAWFTSQDSSRRISVCYEVSSTMLVAPKSVEGWIVDAFQKWGTYYHVSKHIRPNGWSEHDDMSKPPRNIIFTLDGTPHEHCRGDEDLAFYLGVENATVKEGKTKLFDPFAFAAIDESRAPRQRTYGWTPGFIWVADTGQVDPASHTPTWTNFDGLPLQRILLHELGHVFGCTHVDGTIMADLSHWMWEKTQAYATPHPITYFSPAEVARLTSIDEEYDLVTNLRSEETYTIADGSPEHAIDQAPKLVDVFARLVGKPAVGTVTGNVVRTSQPHEGDGVLKLIDSSGTYELPFSITNVLGAIGTTAEAFYFDGFVFDRTSYAYLGTLKLATGDNLPVGITYNMDSTRFALVDLSVPAPDVNAISIGNRPKRFLVRAN